MKNTFIVVGACLVLLIFVGVFSVVNSFTGNPLEAWLARNQMESYLAKTYPGKRFTIQPVRYNFKEHRYVADVVEGDTHPFMLEATAQRVEYDQYHYTYAMDEALTERFNNQYQAALHALLQPISPAFHEASPDLYVAKGTYPPDTQFQTGIASGTRVEIFLMGEMISQEAFVNQCAQMRDAVLKAGYQPSRLRFLYNLPDPIKSTSSQRETGMLLYTLKIEGDLFLARPSDLLKGVELYNQKHLK